MLTSTFQLAAGLGPRREQQLWQAGVARWNDYLAAPGRGPSAADRALRAALARAREAFAARDVEQLAEQLPSAQHWRLFEAFGEDAAYLDIETSDDVVGCAGISAIGILDRSGPRLWLAGRDLEHFGELAQGWSMLVTFNGLSFDLPILRRAFPDWQPP